MSRIVRFAAASLWILSAVSASPAEPPADPAARAREVLAAARQALGGEDAINAVHAITLEGELRRQLPADDGGADPGEMAGSVRVDALVPDRYLRVDTLSPLPGMPGIPLATGLDGDEAWAGPLPVAASSHMVIRTAPPADADARSRMKERVQREAALFLVALLGGGGQASYAWVGEAEAPEGRADVLAVTGHGNLDARLFVDQKTRRPLLLTFADAPPRMMVRRMAPGAERPRGQAAEGPEALPTPPPLAEANLFLSDWKRVGGVLLPHTLRKTLDGKPYEEIVVTRYLVNDPKLTADKFRKKV
jgi:hypothetical protein